jgi:hypothetical protein
MKQIIREVSLEMTTRIESQRKWVRNHYLPDSLSEYDSIEGKLKLLHIILQSEWINKEETNKLQCLGITLGDALIQQFGFKWVEVEDEFGIDPAIKLRDTSIILFPLTMISKRIENGETIDIYSLFKKLITTVNDLIKKAD